MRVWLVPLWVGVAACGSDGDSESSTTVPLDLSGCETGASPEVFLGRGVGGAFQALQPGESLGLTAAPQGGFGVSVLIGTRGLQTDDVDFVAAQLAAESAAVANSAASFQLNTILSCKTDGEGGPHGVIYGAVVGFNSSLSNSDLLAMNGQPATLSVTVTDPNGAVGSVEHEVTLVVGGER